MLGELVADISAKRAEYGRRSKPCEEKSFEKPLREAREAEGWIVQRENKSTFRMRKAKPFDEVLENRFWNTLYRFGYSELNAGRQFRIVVGKGADATEKQVDVFAMDEETVVVAECKACEVPTRRSLLKDLNEFAGLMKPIADAVRRHYGNQFKPKFIWCFVTDKIRWSKEDIKRAENHNINVIRELELLYFEEFSRKLGPAGRFQFHAEYLKDQKVPALSGRKVPAVKTKLGGTTAYLFSALAKDVLRIAFVNHRDLRDPSGAPSYQRIVKPSRLKKIGQFLDNRGYFPNTILLNFHRAPMFEQTAKDQTSGVIFGNLVLPDRYKSCWVIDGQHRLYGTLFTEIDYNNPLFFVAFDKVSKAQEANIFVDINARQATVPPTLLSALDAEVKWDSDVPKERLAAIASRAVDLMNTKGSGPLEGKVVSPGITAGTNQPIHLRSIQERIVLSGLLGSISSKTGQILPGPCWEGTSEKSLVRLVELLDMHLDEVRNANPERWEAGRQGALCTNLGVGSQIRMISELIRFVEFREAIHSSSADLDELYALIKPYMTKMLQYIRDATDDEFKKKFTVIFGSSGYHEYFFKLFSLIESDVPDLKPEGYEEFKKMTSAETTEMADRQVKWIQAVVPMFLRDQLRKKSGENYFEVIVPKEMQKACHIKRVEDESEDKLPVDEYLDWIQYAKIASLKDVRDEVRAALSIPLAEDPSGKHFYSSWFEEMNRIRRIPAHPSGNRVYKSKDIEVLSVVVDHLKSNLPDHYVDGKFDASLS